MPPGFPKNSLPTERVLTAVSMLYPEKMQETLAAFYHASFAEHQDVTEKHIMSSLLAQVHGEDRAETILAKVGYRTKQSMRKLTVEYRASQMK